MRGVRAAGVAGFLVWALVSSGLPGPAGAGSRTITDDGVKNVGSTLAFVALCEMDGYSPVGLSREITRAFGAAFTPSRYDDIMDQYQDSLHDKRLFSPSRQRWITFQVNAENCRDVEKAVSVLLSHLR